MEENKVYIKLDDFIKMRDQLKELELMNNMIIDYVLEYAELDEGKLKIDYNLRYSNFLTAIVKKHYSDKYNQKLKELKKEEDEE